MPGTRVRLLVCRRAGPESYCVLGLGGPWIDSELKYAWVVSVGVGDASMHMQRARDRLQ